MTLRRYDVAIVGGGIVGLATGDEAAGAVSAPEAGDPGERGSRRTHQTGHNSGVLHSGIYYKPGSLKARLCVRGKQELLRFCDEHGIPYNLCGKVIVALNEGELPRLNELYNRGIANGVPGLEMIGPERLKELEPHAAGIKALYSPNTGIIDYVQVAETYAARSARDGRRDPHRP